MQPGKEVAVIGAGAVGSLVAAHLARAGQAVSLVEITGRLDRVRERGIPVTGVADIPAQHPTLLKDPEELAGRDLLAIFVCTKTGALPALLPVLARVAAPETVVVSFQNGIGVEDELAGVLRSEQVCRGVVNFAGGVAPDTGLVTMHWFNPPNLLGPVAGEPGEPLQRLASLLTEAGLATRAISGHDVKQRVFFKAILNAALSPLCAVADITMQQAMTMPHTRSLATAIIREGLAAAAALGYHYGENALAMSTGYLDKGGDHMPSMWYDLDAGRRTEIEHINGKIIQAARMFRGLAVDANVFVTSLIVTKEIKLGVRQPDDVPDYLVSV